MSGVEPGQRSGHAHGGLGTPKHCGHGPTGPYGTLAPIEQHRSVDECPRRPRHDAAGINPGIVGVRASKRTASTEIERHFPLEADPQPFEGIGITTNRQPRQIRKFVEFVDHALDIGDRRRVDSETIGSVAQIVNYAVLRRGRATGAHCHRDCVFERRLTRRDLDEKLS